MCYITIASLYKTSTKKTNGITSVFNKWNPKYIRLCGIDDFPRRPMGRIFYVSEGLSDTIWWIISSDAYLVNINNKIWCLLEDTYLMVLLTHGKFRSIIHPCKNLYVWHAYLILTPSPQHTLHDNVGGTVPPCTTDVFRGSSESRNWKCIGWWSPATKAADAAAAASRATLVLPDIVVGVFGSRWIPQASLCELSTEHTTGLDHHPQQCHSLQWWRDRAGGFQF